MTLPKSIFSYYPLSGKAPLLINFINESKNLGGSDEWSTCSLYNKYYISHLNSISDIFALNFSEWSEEGIKQTYDNNGFRLESNGVFHTNIIENPNISPTKMLETSPTYPNNSNATYGSDEWIGDINNINTKLSTEQININLTKDFSIEMTIVEFNNYHGYIKLYFENLSAGNGTQLYNPGIHINTGYGHGVVRAISGEGDPVDYLTNYNFPLKIKLVKNYETMKLYINNNKISEISSSSLGIGKKTAGEYDNARNLLCPLKLQISTQNNVSDWYMHIKDIYITTVIADNNSDNIDGLYSNINNICNGFTAQYLWNFDDGETSIEEIPKHLFNEDGPHNVSLKVTTEYGANISSKTVTIFPNDNPLEDARNIFRSKNEEIVKNLDTIPDYCSNERLRNIINLLIYDSIRHADRLQNNITNRLKITVDKTVNKNREIRCENSFISDYQSIPIGSIFSSKEHIVRTKIEKNKQTDIVDITFTLPDPE